MKKRADGRYQKKITTLDGKTKFLYSSAKNEREAAKDFNRMLQEIKIKEETGEKFLIVAEEWERSHFKNLTNNSLKSYVPATKDVKDYFSNFYIKEIQPYHVNGFINELVKKDYAFKTVKARYSVLSLIFKHAILNQYCSNNPCQHVAVPKHLKKEKRETVTEIDIEKIKENTSAPFGFFALFLLLTGCRRGEALAITPKDIDFENKMVHINKTVEWIGNKPNIKNSPKTDAGIREIPLADILINELSKRKKQKYIFENHKKELLDNSQVTRGWNEYKKISGVEITPHQLRHGYATILFDAGIDVKTAQRWLGHSDIKTTLDIYTHLSEKKLASSTEKMLDFLNNDFHI